MGFCDLDFKVDENTDCAACLEGRGKCSVTFKAENYCGWENLFMHAR